MNTSMLLCVKYFLGADMLSIGLMSGTSMDGIDAALLETDGSQQLIRLIEQKSINYHPDFKILLKSAEAAIRYCQGNLDQAQNAFKPHLEAYLSGELLVPADK